MNPNNKHPDILLNIDSLVLDGINLSPADAEIVRQTVQAELGRLLTAGNISSTPRNLVSLPKIAAPAVYLSHGGTPKDIGNSVARSVYGSLKI